MTLSHPINIPGLNNLTFIQFQLMSTLKFSGRHVVKLGMLTSFRHEAY